MRLWLLLVFLSVSARASGDADVSGSTSPAAVPAGAAEGGLEPRASTVPAPGADPFEPVVIGTEPAAVGTAEPVESTSTAAGGEPEPPEEPETPKEKLAKKRAERVDEPPVAVTFPEGFSPVRGVHLSAWVGGSPKSRRKFLDRLGGTFINAVVVPVKEVDGLVYIPGVEKAREYKTEWKAIPDPKGLVADLKQRGLRPIARLVVFKDDILPRRLPALAVKRPDGSPWRNAKGVTWVDPYQKVVWDYNLDIAVEAAKAGFEEIQFDYIRFPSDGNISQCRYSRADHTKKSSQENIRKFLSYARERLRPSGVAVSVAVFGMTTTASDDMGIGQDITSMTALADAVSPMMYPSHYYKGEYGLANPNKEPYKVIYRGLRDAKARLKGDSYKLRPYLQDFSLGFRYGDFEVQAQLLAAQKQGIESWILWNPSNLYHWDALQVRPDAKVRFPAAGGPKTP